MKEEALKTFGFLVHLKQYLKNTVRKCVLRSALPQSPSESNIVWLCRNGFLFLCSPTWNVIVV